MAALFYFVKIGTVVALFYFVKIGILAALFYFVKIGIVVELFYFVKIGIVVALIYFVKIGTVATLFYFVKICTILFRENRYSGDTILFRENLHNFISWKSAHWRDYFIAGRKPISILTSHICWLIWVKFGIRYLHTLLLGTCDLREDRHGEGRTIPKGVNKITVTSVTSWYFECNERLTTSWTTPFPMTSLFHGNEYAVWAFVWTVRKLPAVRTNTCITHTSFHTLRHTSNSSVSKYQLLSLKCRLVPKTPTLSS